MEFLIVLETKTARGLSGPGPGRRFNKVRVYSELNLPWVGKIVPQQLIWISSELLTHVNHEHTNPTLITVTVVCGQGEGNMLQPAGTRRFHSLMQWISIKKKHSSRLKREKCHERKILMSKCAIRKTLLWHNSMAENRIWKPVEIKYKTKIKADLHQDSDILPHANKTVLFNGVNCELMTSKSICNSARECNVFQQRAPL